MLECIRSRQRESSATGGGLDDIFSAAADGLATVSHGFHGEPLPVANLTVGEIRRRYADRFDIDPRSQAQIDGCDVDDEAVVRAGQQLTFVHIAGEKGA
jgi:hypothetical protein